MLTDTLNFLDSCSPLVLVFGLVYLICRIICIICAILDQEELPVCHFSPWEPDPTADINMTPYVMSN